MLFILLKSPFHSKEFKFCPGFFGHLGKWLDERVEVHFKIYDMTY